MADEDLRPTARLALEQWALKPATVTEVSRSENIVFRVKTEEGRPYVLRMHRPGYHSYEELVSEQLWTAALREEGIDVPVPLATRHGTPYGQIQVLGETRFVGVLEWVDGATMAVLMESSPDVDHAESRFQQLGGLLAALHNQASRWQSPAKFSRGAVDAEGLMGMRPAWGPFWRASMLAPEQRARFSGYRERLFEILSSIPKTSERYSLIHADLHPYNVVVNGKRLHVIDFDDACFGWHAYDFAVALKNYQAHPHFERLQAALLAGYRRLRAIDDETVEQIPLFLLVRALASIGWADARPELGFREYTLGLAREVDARAEAVLARYE